ncbi:hypothetical protein N8844_03330 [Planktomarina temperata]|nr:hypothetical protein [Planktomarina temperata]
MSQWTLLRRLPIGLAKKNIAKKPNPKDSAVAIIFPNKIATAINNKVLPVVSFIVAEVPSPIISG